MKTWIVLGALMALPLSSMIVVQAADQDEKSGSTGMANPPEAQGKRVTGQLTHIEGWHYTIKASTGEEVSFGVNSTTNDPDKVKEGDQIVATIGDDRIALSLKNMKRKK